MVKILRKSQARLNFQNLVFYWKKLIFRRYCIQRVKDGIQIQVYNITNESVSLFREKLRKVRLRQNDGFLIIKLCTASQIVMKRTLPETKSPICFFHY